MNHEVRKLNGAGGHWSRWFVALLAAGVLLVGCSGDDDSAGEGGGEAASSRASTTATQPPAEGDSQEDAYRLVADVVHEASALTDELYQHPDAVTDPEHEDVDRLRQLYTPDSQGPDEIVSYLQALVDNEQRIQAAPSGIFRDLTLYGMSALDIDTVQFGFCAVQDQETVDNNGAVVERFAEITQGVGEARRVDGQWLLYGLEREEGRSQPVDSGTATPGICEAIYAEERLW